VLLCWLIGVPSLAFRFGWKTTVRGVGAVSGSFAEHTLAL
jgi:hypothetical protein